MLISSNDSAVDSDIVELAGPPLLPELTALLSRPSDASVDLPDALSPAEEFLVS